MNTWPSAANSTRTWTVQIVNALEDWIIEDAGFLQTKFRIQELLEDYPTTLRVREVIQLRKLLSSVGLFSVGSPLLATVLKKRTQNHLLRLMRHPSFIRASFLRANLPNERLPDALPFGGDSNLLRDYLGLLAGRPNIGKKVLVVGPGPTGGQLPENWDDFVVCEILIPGADRQSLSRPLRGSARSLYMNGLSAQWLSSLSDSERAKILNDFGQVYVKNEMSRRLFDEDVLVSRNAKPLFFCGSPNMVQVMVLDQLLRGASEVFVTGATFFLGATPYREGARRLFHSEKKVSDSFGSLGAPFERCAAIAAHDQNTNRAILRRLHDAGRVAGDGPFTESLLLGEEDYCDQLELLYGEPRR